MNTPVLSKPAQLMLNAIIKAVNEGNPFIINDNVETDNPLFCELMFSALVEIVDNKIYPINK